MFSNKVFNDFLLVSCIYSSLDFNIFNLTNNTIIETTVAIRNASKEISEITENAPEETAVSDENEVPEISEEPAESEEPEVTEDSEETTETEEPEVTEDSEETTETEESEETTDSEEPAEAEEETEEPEKKKGFFSRLFGKKKK